MDDELARWLVSPDARPALAEASAQPDPGSLAAATALRRHWTPEQSAVVLGQAVLRRKAVAKFGDRADQLFLTADGLEQATRADVARWRAGRFVDAGAREVVDLGCGLGADALAFLDAGLTVTAVEADPATAVLAQANLGDGAQVICGDAVELADDLLAGGAAVFVDPARRTAAGRTWRLADFSPPWDFVTELLTGRASSGSATMNPGRSPSMNPDCSASMNPGRSASMNPGRSASISPNRSPSINPNRSSSLSRRAEPVNRGQVTLGCIKAAPGLPSTFIPENVVTTWVSHRGDLVEASLWSGPWRRGSRTAVLLPSGDELDAGERREPPVGPIGRYLYEPDPAVIRAGAIGTLAELVNARVAQPGIAYLFTDTLVATPFATGFEVLDVLPNDERTLRAWVRDQGIGVLEIKVRGLDVDPAALRRRLKPKGPASATVVLTPTTEGARALAVRRMIAG